MEGKILAQGEIANNAAPPAGLTAIFAPGGERLGVRLHLSSIHATPQTIYVYTKMSGGSNTFHQRVDLSQWECADLFFEGLGNGDEVLAVTNTDNAAYYTIFGME